MQSVLQGSLWGLVVGGVGLSFASLVTEQPVFASGPAAPQLAVPQLEVAAESPGVTVVVPAEDSPTFAPVAPLTDVAAVAEAAPEVATEPAALPETAEVETAIDAPEAVDEPALESAVDAPIATTIDTELAETAPESAGPVVDTAPAAPLVISSEDAATPTADAEVDTPEVIVIELGTTTEDDAEAAEDSAPLIIIADAATEQEDDAPAEPVDAPSTPTEDEAAQDEVAVAPEPEREVEEPIVAADEPATTETPDPIVVEPETQVADTDAPVTVTPALPQTNTAVRINRLGVETEDVVETTQDDALPDDAPALLRFAAAFEGPANLPLISVILIDTGAADVAPADLSALGFTPTVAVNALASDAADTMAAYRAAGLEVAMQADLPDGAQPVDVEVAFEAAFAQLPEVAMLFSNGAGALQDRAVTAQVMEILAADGRGFVTVQRGLGNATRTAEQAGVPAATVLRDLDGAGEDSGAITRALDQAAFRARQSGDAVLLGRLTPQTVDALQAWAADLDQETLALAPVSAVLLRQVE